MTTRTIMTITEVGRNVLRTAPLLRNRKPGASRIVHHICIMFRQLWQLAEIPNAKVSGNALI